MRSLLISLFFTSALFAQNKAAKLDSLFTGLYREGKFNGNVLIAEKGKVTYQKSFGKADLAEGRDLNAESMFELASVSKQFTAMSIMLLKKQGKLDYSDSLRQYFPELPYYNITIEQMLHHVSGLPDYIGLMMEKTVWDKNKIATNADMIALFAKHKPPVLFAPGEKWEYSNTGYALLASIVEKVSGMEYGTFLSKNIFGPLGMERTMLYRRRYENKKLDNYAYGYVMNLGTRKYVLPDSLPATAALVIPFDGIIGDGYISSTTNDLLKWDRALYTEQLVPREMMEQAFTKAKLNNGKLADYGFGWGVAAWAKGRLVNHSGGWPGYATFIERHLDSDKTIIILRNQASVEPSPQKIRNILFDIKEEVHTEIKLDAEKLKEYIGEYELTPDFAITITTDKDRIFAQASGQARFEIFPEKTDYFFWKVVDAQLQFGRDDKGNVIKLTLYQNGAVVDGPKK